MSWLADCQCDTDFWWCVANFQRAQQDRDGRQRNNKSSQVRDRKNNDVEAIEGIGAGAYLFNGIVRNQDVQEPIISYESVSE